MSGKNKLARFAEMAAFSNVFQVPFKEAQHQSHSLKGNWSKEVFKNNKPIVLELGCGKGEYTVGMAKVFPNKNFIGIDIKGARMWRGAKTALEENIDNARFLRTRIELVDSFFSENEISEIWITFPDPQMRRDREAKRLTSPGFMKNYFKFLKSGGLIHLKTDSAFLFEYTNEIAASLPVIITITTPKLYMDIKNFDLPEKEKEILGIPTFYEKKFSEIGHEICYIQMKYTVHE